MVSARSLALMLILCMLRVAVAAGQSTDASGRTIRYGAHVGPSLTTLGAGLSGGLTVEVSRHVFSLRASSTDLDVGKETWDVGVLYGRAFFAQSLMVEVSTGIAVVSGTRYTTLFGSGPAEDLNTMIGFPLEGAITWSPTSIFGVGVRGFANVNTGQPFGGLGVTLRVGRLR